MLFGYEALSHMPRGQAVKVVPRLQGEACLHIRHLQHRRQRIRYDRHVLYGQFSSHRHEPISARATGSHAVLPCVTCFAAASLISDSLTVSDFEHCETRTTGTSSARGRCCRPTVTQATRSTSSVLSPAHRTGAKFQLRATAARPTLPTAPRTMPT
jgi:hypothetical protein